VKHPIREEQLDAWLRDAADAALPALQTPNALTARVYRKFHRRRIARQIAGATTAVAALLTISGIAVFYRGTSAPSPTAPRVASIPPTDLEQLRSRLAVLEKELAAQKARLELLADARQNPREKPVISAEALLPPESLVQIEWEQVATMVLARAERLTEAKRKQEAAAEYRRIIDNFPATSLVDTAKKQLQQLTSN
jgi:hypothetical protein